MENLTESTIQKASVPRIALGELSTVGLRVADGHVWEEARAELRYPLSLNTFKEMSYDPTISAANNTIKAMIRRLDWSVGYENTDKPTVEQESNARFINECMDDMETSWSDFINEALSILIYGHSIHEKVFKYRRGTDSGKYGSKYSDGKLGWAKLPIRSQDTIYRWIYDDKGQTLRFVEQDLSSVASLYTTSGNIAFKDTKIKIPYKKLLHFRHDVQRGNPEGNSPLRSVYIPWKYKTKIEEYEAVGVAR